MTDEQWVNLTAWLKLPPEARAPIENELDLYARVAANAGKAPSETRKKLERVAALADDLLKAIEEFGPESEKIRIIMRAPKQPGSSRSRYSVCSPI